MAVCKVIIHQSYIIFSSIMYNYTMDLIYVIQIEAFFVYNENNKITEF